MSTDDQFTAQQPKPPCEPFPDFRIPGLPRKPVWPGVLFNTIWMLLVPIIICSGLLSIPANDPYREYFRPINEFFSTVSIR